MFCATVAIASIAIGCLRGSMRRAVAPHWPIRPSVEPSSSRCCSNWPSPLVRRGCCSLLPAAWITRSLVGELRAHHEGGEGGGGWQQPILLACTAAT
eukprot:scaffold33917_cov71-Phaeocystis_antarctica.AAC.2